MANFKKHIVLPKYRSLLEVFGQNLKLARKRRKLTTTQVSERADVDRGTLRKIETGDPSVSLGAYINVLKVYHIEEEILKVAADDPFGRKLQDIETLN